MQAKVLPLPGVDNTHMIVLSPPQTTGRNKEQLVLFLLCDCSLSMGSAFKDVLIPACTAFYKEVQPGYCQVILFGQKTTLCLIDNPKKIEVRAHPHYPLSNDTYPLFAGSGCKGTRRWNQYSNGNHSRRE